MSNPRLEDWCMGITGDEYIAPECRSSVLHGKVYDHPSERFEDGDPVRTSRIQELDLKAGIAKTLNTTYKLGVPDKEWVAWLKANGYDKIDDFISRDEETG